MRDFFLGGSDQRSFDCLIKGWCGWSRMAQNPETGPCRSVTACWLEGGKEPCAWQCPWRAERDRNVEKGWRLMRAREEGKSGEGWGWGALGRTVDSGSGGRNRSNGCSCRREKWGQKGRPWQWTRVTLVAVKQMAAPAPQRPSRIAPCQADSVFFDKISIFPWWLDSEGSAHDHQKTHDGRHFQEWRGCQASEANTAKPMLPAVMVQSWLIVTLLESPNRGYIPFSAPSLKMSGVYPSLENFSSGSYWCIKVFKFYLSSPFLDIIAQMIQVMTLGFVKQPLGRTLGK